MEVDRRRLRWPPVLTSNYRRNRGRKACIQRLQCLSRLVIWRPRSLKRSAKVWRRLAIDPLRSAPIEDGRLHENDVSGRNTQTPSPADLSPSTLPKINYHIRRIFRASAGVTRFRNTTRTIHGIRLEFPPTLALTPWGETGQRFPTSRYRFIP